MKKLLLASAAVGTLSLGAAPALAQSPPHTVTANVGLFSEYIFRGTAQTGGEPAVQGGFDYAHSSGLYLGTWASNVSWLQDFGAYNRSSLEWDFYGGFKRNIGSTDFYFDVGTIYYYYPGNANPGIVKANSWEIYAGLGWKFLGLKYSYSLKDYFGARPNANADKTDGSWYLDFFADYAIPNTGFSVNAHYGILDVRNDGTEALGTKVSYNDWKIGAAYTVQSGVLKDLQVGVYYTDTDVKKNAAGASFWVDRTGFDTADSTVVAYVKKTF
ncbi:MAG: TorF family putative porin [Burkholderiales bacterium]|nr:TorF family putative porin [Burkholderiales bacterium]